MGLDMYAIAVDPSVVGDAQVDFEIPEGTEIVHVAYWRKHHDLHGWMERLYTEKGGTSRSFNCDNLVLTNDDLDRLEKDVKAHNLPETTGFFFGDNPPDDESVKEDLEFIENARDQIQAGKVVFYSSWW